MNLILFLEHEINNIIPGNDPRTKHIRRTLKFQVNDLFEAGIVNGNMGKGKILRIDKTGMEFKFIPESQPTPLHPVTLVVGLTRPQIAKHILRECASIGISEIKFYQTELGEKSYIDSTLWQNDNCQNQLIKGAGQGFTTLLPKITFYNNLNHVLESTTESSVRIALDNVKPESTLTNYALKDMNVSLILGSERGLTDHERLLLKNSSIPILKLGDRILRTDTACIVGLTLILSKMQLI